MQKLLDKKKADRLEPEEMIELEAIGELDNIFSYINAVFSWTADGLHPPEDDPRLLEISERSPHLKKIRANSLGRTNCSKKY